MIMKMGFLISRCWQFAFCISISAADLPEDLRQIRNYFNNPPAITNLTFVKTNYISPFAFRSKSERQEAMKSGYNPDKPTISYWAYSHDSAIPGIVFRSFPAKYFDANHNLIHPSILTNYPISKTYDYSIAPVSYGGRIGGDWWIAHFSDAYSLEFDVLTNSIDGTKLWETNSTQISTRFRDSNLGEGSVFHHFGYGLFEAGSWEIEADLTSTNLFNWRGVSKIYGKISGNIWRTNGGRIWFPIGERELMKDGNWSRDLAFTDLPKNRNWMIDLDSVSKQKRNLTIRLIWDDEAQMPKQFFDVNLFKGKHKTIERILRSYTKVDSPMIWWRDYPDAFHFTYHTNSGNRRGNLIVLNSTNGADFVLPSKSNRDYPEYDRRPFFSSGVLRFVLFIFVITCIFLLSRKCCR